MQRDVTPCGCYIPIHRSGRLVETSFLRWSHIDPPRPIWGPYIDGIWAGLRQWSKGNSIVDALPHMGGLVLQKISQMGQDFLAQASVHAQTGYLLGLRC